MTAFSKTLKRLTLFCFILSNIRTSGFGLMSETLLIKSLMLFKSTTIFFFFFETREEKKGIEFSLTGKKKKKPTNYLLYLSLSMFFCIFLSVSYFLVCFSWHIALSRGKRARCHTQHILCGFLSILKRHWELFPISSSLSP